MRRVLIVLALLGATLAGLAAWVVALNLRGESAMPESPAPFEATAAQVERGRYLALAGNCAGCHTARGGAPYAGGVPIRTPFGTVFASNLTPHPREGIGDWSAAHFWRAMHHGRSKDGRLLSPAFPYPSFTQITREDSDALYAYLRTLPPADVPNRADTLRFPYGSQAALAIWRALYFRARSFEPDPARPAAWNRGAYLVNGLGHCVACHGPRNELGAIEEKRGLSGGTLATEGWYAPSLTDSREAGVADWPVAEIASLLKAGRSSRASVMGPMADVVFDSLQHLSDADIEAMAVFLKSLPDAGPPAPAPTPVRRDPVLMARGERIYDQRCAYCHGDRGQGAVGAYPPLAGNRAVLMESPANLVQMVRDGGFLPATGGNPRPYGMPPFGPVLDDDGIAAVLSYVRGAWGNDAPPVSRTQARQR